MFGGGVKQKVLSADVPTRMRSPFVSLGPRPRNANVRDRPTDEVAPSVAPGRVLDGALAAIPLSASVIHCCRVRPVFAQSRLPAARPSRECAEPRERKLTSGGGESQMLSDALQCTAMFTVNTAGLSGNESDYKSRRQLSSTNHNHSRDPDCICSGDT
ncbi:Hypothetical protein SMAX5B_008614 [Scophthalmus maximus]|uniref:Uncharacterized protein n=1 Tax=Scophthalmus maximus TaxID=52904 RepID=A0A2U9CDM2_SCOMX|nr:Hypothetical protein SMAX5B_008614 [Scophthalmus maximus]